MPARRMAAALGLLSLAACTSPPPKNRPPDTGRPPPAAAPATADASFDWRPLVAAPFGTLLKDSPIRLHEVLLFHEEPHAPAENESKDCYAVGGTPPTFAGSPPDEYLMCFEHDRLDRIDAAVRIPAEDAARLFGRACAQWSENAKPMPGADEVCEGRDGDIAFRARLAVVPGEPTAELLMTLSDAAKTDAAKTDAQPSPPRDPGAPPLAAP
jgi:hypothetical protein